MKAAKTVALALVLVVLPIYAKDKHAPLPASVIAAKTVYIDNQTGHAEMQRYRHVPYSRTFLCTRPN
jgi:hypothetical protein